jgi:hypothetical protein
MSIRPIRFNDGGTIDVWHDERAHGGTVKLADITLLGDNDFLLLKCPVANCNSESLHPVGGGAAPEEVQTLFVHVYKQSKDLPELNTWNKSLARVKQRAEALDGVGRFRLEDVKEQSTIRT